MKNILVVGGASGIGAVLVQSLLERNVGYRVGEKTSDKIINLDIRPNENGNQSTTEIGVNVHNIFCDLSFDSSIRTAIDQLKEYVFDEVYYCAGIAEPPTDSLKSDYEFINNITAINSTSVPKILSSINVRKGGAILILSSAHSKRAAALNPIYSATKGFLDAFVVSYSKSLIDQHKKSGHPLVRINAVNPEMVDTPLIRNLFLGQDEKLAQVTKTRILGRLLSSQEVVNTCLFLNSDSASGITGETVAIGGKI